MRNRCRYVERRRVPPTAVPRRSRRVTWVSGCDDPPTGGAAPARATLGLWLMGGSSGAGPKIFSTGISGRVIGPNLGSGASPTAWLREAVCAVRWAVPRAAKVWT